MPKKPENIRFLQNSKGEKMVIEYEFLKDELEEYCVDELKKSIEKFTLHELYIPLQRVIHSVDFTDKTVTPNEKEINNDLKTICDILMDPLWANKMEGEGVVFWIYAVIWEHKKLLKSINHKNESTNYKNFLKLVMMIYECYSGRYLEKKEVDIFEEDFKLFWEYFNSGRWETQPGMNETEAKPHVERMSLLDNVRAKYGFKELNDFSIVKNSVDVMTKDCLQICFEEHCSEGGSLRKIIESFFSEHFEGLDSEYRRFSRIFKIYMNEPQYYRERTIPDELSHNIPKIAATRIKDIKLLYFASLDKNLLGHQTLGEERMFFAQAFVAEIFGENEDVQTCIIQAKIFLALSNKWKIKEEELEKADYQKIDTLADYLSEPVEIKGRKVYIHNILVENWHWIRLIADKLKNIESKEKLSKSREEKVFKYIKEIYQIQPYVIRVRYLKNESKFIAALQSNLWLTQQKQILDNCHKETLKVFRQEVQKIAKDTAEKPDDIILEMVDGDFTSKGVYTCNYHQLSTRYLKMVLKYMWKLQKEADIPS